MVEQRMSSSEPAEGSADRTARWWDERSVGIRHTADAVPGGVARAAGRRPRVGVAWDDVPRGTEPPVSLPQPDPRSSAPVVFAGATLREWLIATVAVLALVISFFSLAAGVYLPVWLVPGAGLVLSVLLPLAAATLLLVRRYSVPRLRLGSFGLDQVASAVAVGAVIGWIDLLHLSTGSAVAGIGLILGLALVALTVAAPAIPGLRSDFDERTPAPAPVQALGARPLPHAHDEEAQVVSPSVTLALGMVAPRAVSTRTAPLASAAPAAASATVDPVDDPRLTEEHEPDPVAEAFDVATDAAGRAPSSVDVLEVLMSDATEEPSAAAQQEPAPILPLDSPPSAAVAAANLVHASAVPVVRQAEAASTAWASPLQAAAGPPEPREAGPSADELPLRATRRQLRADRRAAERADGDALAGAEPDVVLEPVMPVVPAALGEMPTAFAFHEPAAPPKDDAPASDADGETQVLDAVFVAPALTTNRLSEEEDEGIATVDRDSLARLLADTQRASAVAEQARRNATQRVRVHAAAERRATLEATARAESHARIDGSAAAETSAWERGVAPEPPAPPAITPAHNGFWALAPSDRAVVDSSGTAIFHIGPTAWALVIEDRGSAFLIRHKDGRVGLLTNLTGVIRS